MSSLGNREKQLLLALARRALISAVRNRESLNDLPNDETLQRPGGAFVTLHLRGRLRGCVGQLASKDTLAEVVAHCSKSAALEDPRFEEVSTAELPGIEIELSVLSVPVDVELEQIQPGKHGLIVSSGRKRGVLLPQVAEQFHWNARQFLEETCVKADLAPDAWKDPATRVQAFTAEVFSEADFPATE
jgi:AmmeMemoRadiSam system protein A